MGDEHINPELRERLEQQKRERLANSPSGRYRPEMDPARPASMQRGSDMLPLFWIAYFAIFGLLAWWFGSGS